MAKTWAEAEGLGPRLEAVLGGVGVPVLSCCLLTADNEVLIVALLIRSELSRSGVLHLGMPV